MSDSRSRSRRSVRRMALVAAGMFGFAIFVLPPLYDVLCDILGINGKNISTTAKAVEIDRSREVAVEFIANVYKGTPIEFTAPDPAKIRIHPGEVEEVSYYARNTSHEVVWAQAIHSIVPGLQAKHINILACFCFDKQKFEPGEAKKLTFAFYVAPKLPQEQKALSVSYTFFKIDPPEEEE